MTQEQATSVLVTVTLVEMMFAIGLGVSMASLVAVARDARRAGLAAVANYVIVPAATIGLCRAFDVTPLVAAGFLILAACPGAPFGPLLAGLARGNVATATGLMVLLAGSSALVAPALLPILLRRMTEDDSLTVDSGGIVRTLLATQLLPLAAGLAVRHWRPQWAERLLRPRLASGALNLALVSVILSTQGHLIAEIRWQGFCGMSTLLVASWGAGWMCGGPTHEDRRSLMLTTALRNVGVGLAIAGASFPGTSAVTAVLVYGLIEIFGTLLLAVVLGRIATDGAA